MHFHYRVTFTGYILCFGATTSHDLVTLTFWPWEFRVQCFSCRYQCRQAPHAQICPEL